MLSHIIDNSVLLITHVNEKGLRNINVPGTKFKKLHIYNELSIL